jgi:hypothetical protein
MFWYWTQQKRVSGTLGHQRSFYRRFFNHLVPFLVFYGSGMKSSHESDGKRLVCLEELLGSLLKIF